VNTNSEEHKSKVRKGKEDSQQREDGGKAARRREKGNLA